MRLTAATAERPWPGHDHDRLALLPDLGRYALFDGAGQEFASEAAADAFAQQELLDGDPPSLQEAFQAAHLAVARRQLEPDIAESYQGVGFAAHEARTTGLAVSLHVLAELATIEYIGAGDSPLYVFEHPSKDLTKLTHDEPFSNFLGAPNLDFIKHVSRNSGSHAVRHATTLALMSDGITSDKLYPGSVTPEALGIILGPEATPKEKAARLVHATRLKDDASAIVIEIK